MAYPFVPSYFDYGPRNAVIKPLAINVHMAEGGGTVGFLAKANPNKVAVHYVIEKGGRIVQMLHESHVNGSINPRDIRTTDDPPFNFRGEWITYGVTAAKKALGIWWDDPNRATIGIEIEGFAKDGPNAVQASALVRLVADIRTRQPGAPLLGHRDFADYKACPGKRIDWAAMGGHGVPDAPGGDMAIRVPAAMETGYRIDVPAGTIFYADADCTDKLGPIESSSVAKLVYAGAPIGEKTPSRAAVHTTGYPYSGDERWPTIVYFKDAEVGDPYRVPVEPTNPAEPAPYTVIVGGKEVGSVTLP